VEILEQQVSEDSQEQLVSQVRTVIRVQQDKLGILELLEARALLARSDSPGIKAFKEQLEVRVLQGRLDHKDNLET